MPAYDRNEANAVFMSGDAAFTVADSLWWGTFNDPAKSKIAGKVGAARFPVGPATAKTVRLGRHLGLGDPEVDLGRAQGARQADAGGHDDGRGRPDQVVEGDRRAAAQHAVLAQDRGAGSVHEAAEGVVLDMPDKVRGAYYFPQWPAVHKAFNDTVTKAVTGKREDIAKVLAEGAPLVSKAAQ